MKNNKFSIITPVYNSEKWIQKCLNSIKCQTYQNYEAIVINSCSTDNTGDIIEREIVNDKRFHFFNLYKRKYALENTIDGIHFLCQDIRGCNWEDIIVIVDGDDWLPSNDVLEYLNKIYQEDIWTTWGQFKMASTDKIGKFGKENWCKDITGRFDRKKMTRFYFSHLRTYKYFLFNNIKEEDLKNENGEYYTTAGDVVIALPIIEMAGEKHRKYIQKIMYCYNDLNQLNDMKRCPKEQTDIFYKLRQKLPYEELKCR